MPDNYRRRRAEALFVDEATKRKRLRMEGGRAAAKEEPVKVSSYAAQRRREREAQRLVQEMEESLKKKEFEESLDPDKHYLTFGRRREKEAEPSGPETEPDAIVGFRGDFAWLSPDDMRYPVMDKRHVLYPSLEHAFQAQKANSRSARDAILTAPTARDAKRLGAKALQDKEEFRKRAKDEMIHLVRDKFLRHVELQSKLIATGDRRLVYANDFGDVNWGRCDGKGRNDLGDILETLRDDLVNNRLPQLIVKWIDERVRTEFDKRDLAWQLQFQRRKNQDDGDVVILSQDHKEVNAIEERTWFTVGRDPAVSQLTLEHASTSRAHAALMLCGKRCFVVDLNSAHGTFLLDPTTQQKIRLKPFEPAQLTSDTTEVLTIHAAAAPEKKPIYSHVSFGRSSRWFRLRHLETKLRQVKQERLYDKVSRGDDDGPRRLVKIVNISYEATADDIRNDLLDNIDIKALVLPMQHHKRHSGYALVELANDRSLVQALACDQDELKGRKVRISRPSLDDDHETIVALRQLNKEQQQLKQ